MLWRWSHCKNKPRGQRSPRKGRHRRLWPTAVQDASPGCRRSATVRHLFATQGPGSAWEWARSCNDRIDCSQIAPRETKVLLTFRAHFHGCSQHDKYPRGAFARTGGKGRREERTHGSERCRGRTIRHATHPTAGPPGSRWPAPHWPPAEIGIGGQTCTTTSSHSSPT